MMISLVFVIACFIKVIAGQTRVHFLEDPSSDGTIKAIYGKVAFVPCVVNSNKTPSYVKWFHENSEVFAFERDSIIGVRKDRYSFPSGLENGNFTLQINNVRREDNGTFYCIVSFGIGKSSNRGKLQVHIPPDEDYPQCKTIHNGEDYPKPGDSITLSCITRGEDPLLHLSWSDKSAKVVHNEVTNDLIKVVTLRKEDNGKPYTCSAFGFAVDPPRTCTVVPLKVYPTVEFKVANTDVYQGNNVVLECHGVGLPDITEYKWYYDEKFIGQSFERFKLSSDKTRLVISDITMDDKGKVVVCRVSVISGLASNVSGTIQVRQIVTAKPSSPLVPIQDDYSIILIIGVSLGFIIFILIIVIAQMCCRKMRIMGQLNLQYQESTYEEMNANRCDAISFDKLSMGSLSGLSYISGNPYIFRTPESCPASVVDGRRDSSSSISPPQRNSFTPSRASSPYFDRRSSHKSSRSNTPPETPNRTGSPSSAYLSPRYSSDSPFFPRRGSLTRSSSPQPIHPPGVEPPFLRSLHDQIANDLAVPSKRVMEIKASEGIQMNQMPPSTGNDSSGSMPHLLEKAVEQTYEEMPLTRKVRDWRTTSF